METYPAGSITFVISENHKLYDEISDDEAYYLTNSFVDYFRFQLSKNRLDDVITVTGVEYYRGCVTIIITIGAVVAAAGGGLALVGFFKNYKAVREGLDKFLEDMKNMKAWIKRKIFKKPADQTAIIPEKAGPETEKTEVPFQILFEQVIDQYNSITPEQRKFWTAGQYVTIMNEKGEYSKYTVAVKREDIALPHDNITPKEKVEKLDEKIKPKQKKKNDRTKKI